MVVIKRSNRDDDVESLAMANCLMLISQMDEDQLAISGRVYECKTCRKKFHSFQALGGHRASHKRPRILDGYGHCLRDDKKHVCTVCGLEFERGQALGGHMSKHRTHNQQLPVEDNSRDNINNNNNSVNNKSADNHRHSGSTVVVKEQQEQEEEDTSSESIKEAAAKAVVAWDLNLTPFQNEINELILATDYIPPPIN